MDNPIGDNIKAALEATTNARPEVQVAAVQAAAAAIPPPVGADIGWLWKALVSGLIAVLIFALGGIIWTVVDGKDSTSPDVLLTVFSSVLTGLIGLFVKAPGT
jgi:hypothetical protein